MNEAKIEIKFKNIYERPQPDLNSLTVKTQNPEIDLWQDPVFRAEQIQSNPQLVSTTTWMYRLTYEFHAGLFTKGKLRF